MHLSKTTNDYLPDRSVVFSEFEVGWDGIYPLVYGMEWVIDTSRLYSSTHMDCLDMSDSGLPCLYCTTSPSTPGRQLEATSRFDTPTCIGLPPGIGVPGGGKLSVRLYG